MEGFPFQTAKPKASKQNHRSQCVATIVLKHGRWNHNHWKPTCINRSPRTKYGYRNLFLICKATSFHSKSCSEESWSLPSGSTYSTPSCHIIDNPSILNQHSRPTPNKEALSFVQQSISEKHPEKNPKNSSSPNPPTPAPRLPSEATWPSFPSAWRRRTARAWSRRPSRDRRRWRVGWAGPGWSTRTPRPEALGNLHGFWLGSIYFITIIV
jgi:hypothetical protein